MWKALTDMSNRQKYIFNKLIHLFFYFTVASNCNAKVLELECKVKEHNKIVKNFIDIQKPWWQFWDDMITIEFKIDPEKTGYSDICRIQKVISNSFLITEYYNCATGFENKSHEYIIDRKTGAIYGTRYAADDKWGKYSKNKEKPIKKGDILWTINGECYEIQKKF